MKRARGSVPRLLLLLSSVGALPIVVLDAALRAQASRLCTALPLALLLALLLAWPAHVVASALRRLQASGWAWPVFGALAILGLGGLLSNVLLIDQPFQPATCVGYGLSVVAALGFGAFVRRVFVFDRRESALAVAVLLAAALALVVDRFAFPVQYRDLHAALRVAAVLASTTSAWFWLERGSTRAPHFVGLAALLLIAVPLLPAAVVHRSLFTHQTPEGRIAESLLQGTAETWLGPLVGARRCAFGPSHVGLLDARVPCPIPAPATWTNDAVEGTRPERPDRERAAAGVRPRALVLVTVDAFRCGLGRRERAPFRDGCPRLEALARRPGAALDSVQVSYPATRPALLDLHCFGSENAGNCLAGRLASLGFPGTAIATHRQLQLPLVMESFAGWDATLLPLTALPASISGTATTERAISTLAGSTGATRFVWAHYFDPHDPYVPANDSHFSLSAEAAYGAELARTDDAIAALVGALERAGEPAVVAITGDHGESFGEHGTSHHGYELYEPSVRVPFVAIPFHGAALPQALPRQSIDIAPYLLALAGGPPFTPAAPRPMRTENLWGLSNGRYKLVVDRLDGRVELYDLSADADERDDVAEARPDLVSELLAGLAAAL